MKSKNVGFKLTEKEINKIKKIVKQGNYINLSDFYRQAVRDKIRGVKHE